MKPVLYDKSAAAFTSNGKGTLDLISCEITEERNGMFELEAEISESAYHASEIEMNSYIKAKVPDQTDAQLFRVYKITKPLKGIYKIQAQHKTYQLSFIPSMPFSVTASSSACSQALTGLKTNAAESCQFNFSTDVTTVASFGIGQPTSIRNALGGMEGSILDRYGGEFKWNNDNVYLLRNRGTIDPVVTLRYGKDIIDINQEENISQTITGVVPFWVKTDGSDLVTLPEKVVDSQHASSYPFKRTVVLDCSQHFEEKPTQTALRDYAQAYVNANGVGIPSVSIKVSFINLKTEIANSLQEVKLCDRIGVVFEKLGINTIAQVVKYVYDVLKERYISIEVGTIKQTLATTISGNMEDIEGVGAITKDMINKSTTALEGNISDALGDAKDYADGVASTAQSNAESYADGAASTAQSNAESYADGAASTAQSNAESYADGAASTAQSNAESYADGAASSAETNAKNYADSAASAAQSNAESYADGAASTAQSNAESYADGAASSAETNAKNYADSAASAAQSNAKTYTDNAVAGLQTAQQVQNAIDNATAWLTGSNGYVMAVKDNNGKWQELIFADHNDPQQWHNLLRINENGIGFSSDGGQTYTQAWTLDGKLVIGGTNVPSLTVYDNSTPPNILLQINSQGMLWNASNSSLAQDGTLTANNTELSGSLKSTKENAYGRYNFHNEVSAGGIDFWWTRDNMTSAKASIKNTTEALGTDQRAGIELDADSYLRISSDEIRIINKTVNEDLYIDIGPYSLNYALKVDIDNLQMYNGGSYYSAYTGPLTIGSQTYRIINGLICGLY